MVVPTRYAKSLIDLAIEKNKLEEVRNDMLVIKNVCSLNHDFVLLLDSPVIKTDKKIAVFKSVFEGKISALTLSFLNLIASKRREGYVNDITKAFDEQYKQIKNITTVKVETAIALDEKSRKSIMDIVKKNVTGEIELIEKVNASLIGGFVLTINDKQADQSVSRMLNNLRKNFTGNDYVPTMN